MKRFHLPPILPNGPAATPAVGHCGGRRPMMPQFDLDANEILKVKKCRNVLKSDHKTLRDKFLFLFLNLHL
jgi:hypothetical protein